MNNCFVQQEFPVEIKQEWDVSKKWIAFIAYSYFGSPKWNKSVVSSSCYNKISLTTEFYFSLFWSLGSTRSRCKLFPFLVRTLSLACRWPCSCYALMGERERALVSLLFWGSGVIMRTLPSWHCLNLIIFQSPHIKYYHIGN